MSVQEIASRIVEVLAHKPAGLFSDFDGALSEIAATPGGAIAYPGAAEALGRIAARVDAAGVITGRAVDDLASKLPADNLIVVGNHGLEWSEKDVRHDHQAGLDAIDAIKNVMDETRNELASHTDVDKLIWENKRLSASIHFRNAHDPATVERELLPIAQRLAAANNVRLTPGKMIVEVRPMAIVTKGTALREIVEKYKLGSAIFIGDDLTDVDGFRALSELRRAGKHTLSVGVVAADAHPDIAATADVVVSSVAEVVTMLTMVADRLDP